MKKYINATNIQTGDGENSEGEKDKWKETRRKKVKTKETRQKKKKEEFK